MNTIIIQILVGLAANAAIIFLLKEWIKARLSGSIKLEYDAKLEEIKRDNDIRFKAELTADIISEWQKGDKADYGKLNALCYKAYIYFPEDLIVDLCKRLTHQKDAKHALEIILEARRRIQKSSDTVTVDIFAHF